MTGELLDFVTAPEELFQLLYAHLPTSLTILRRLQFARLVASGDDRILFASDTGVLGGDASRWPQAFTVTSVDFSRGPDTQIWIYSTLEDKGVTGVAEYEYRGQLQATLQALMLLKKQYGKELTYGDCVLLGAVHSDVRSLLAETGRVQHRDTGFYDKWLFRDEHLPFLERPLPDGMYWTKANLDDCREAVASTNIPRRAYVQQAKTDS